MKKIDTKQQKKSFVLKRHKATKKTYQDSIIVRGAWGQYAGDCEDEHNLC
jgi:hypothetical protein